MKNNRETGSRYEQKAAAYLTQAGYRVLEMNYCCPFGEIDVIGEKGAVLVFFEVKYRRDSSFGHPLEAVDEKKQKRIYRTARHYLDYHHIPPDRDCRFDVIGILGNTITHIKSAFGGM